jgi:hypothetical protein
MRLLSQVAKGGNAVLFTIHQPSSNVFSSFDRLVLLNQGRVMHQGSVANIGHDFAALGFPLPPNYNPADWVLDVAQIHKMEELESKGFFGKAPEWLLEFSTTNPLVTEKQPPPPPLEDPQHVSMWPEFKLLQRRDIKGIYRNPTQMMINVGATSVLSVIFGVIFFGVGREDRTQYPVSRGLSREWILRLSSSDVLLSYLSYSLIYRRCNPNWARLSTL